MATTLNAVELIQSVLSQCEVIDLSVFTSKDYPAWFAKGVPYREEVYLTYDDPNVKGFFTRIISCEEHIGTHFDAPIHVIPPEGSGLPFASSMHELSGDRIPLDQFQGRALVIDCQSLLDQAAPGLSPIISADYLREWESRNGRILPDDRVLLASGYSDRYYKPFPAGERFSYAPAVLKTCPGWPAPDESGMALLVERGVRLVGTDGSAMGPIENDYPPHPIGLGSGMVFLEKLINLLDLPVRGAYFFFAPMKLKGNSGAPGRAFGIKMKGLKGIGLSAS